MCPLNVPGPKSKEYIRRGNRLFPGGAKKEEAAVKLAEAGFPPYPELIVAKAEGSWLVDVDDNRYVDFTSGWASNNVGNVHPEVLEPVIQAMKQYSFCYKPAIAVELAEKLAEISPNKKLTRVSYEISGTEAAEAGVSNAIVHKKRPLIICLHSQFHGDSIAARVLSSIGGGRRRGLERGKEAFCMHRTHIPMEFLWMSLLKNTLITVFGVLKTSYWDRKRK